MRKLLSLISISILLFTSCSKTLFVQTQPQDYDPINANEISSQFHGKFIDSRSLQQFSAALIPSLERYPFDYEKREMIVDSAVSTIRDSIHLIINSDGISFNLRSLSYFDDSLLTIKEKGNLLYLNAPKRIGGPINNEMYHLLVIKLDGDDRFLINVGQSSGWLDTNNINYLEDTSNGDIIISDISIDQLDLLVNSRIHESIEEPLLLTENRDWFSKFPNRLLDIDDVFTKEGELTDLYFEILDELLESNDESTFKKSRIKGLFGE